MVTPCFSLNETIPFTGENDFSNFSGSLIVLIAANALIVESGKASARRFAAPQMVEPSVMISSTMTISSGG